MSIRTGKGTVRNEDGLVTTELSAKWDSAHAIGIQPDGKILVAGSSVESGALADFSMARYNSDGSLDPTFGTDGTVVSPLSTQTDEVAAVIAQQDGKILLVGYVNLDLTNTAFAVARYNADGSLDPTFGTAGSVSTDLTSGFDWAWGAALQPDGRLLVAGGANELGPGADFAIVRYNVCAPVEERFSIQLPLVLSGT